MTSASEPYYLFASSRSWNRPGYDDLVASLGINADWVSCREELDSAIQARSPRYIFFLHWNWFVPHDIWSQYECVCFHMTDVPYGRGGSPLQNLIVAGHKATKLTALKMVDEPDAGPVYAKSSLSLKGRAQDIYLRAGRLSLDIARWMIETNPEPVPQQGEVTTFKRRTPSQSRLPSSGTLESVYDYIRMLDAPGYPLAFLDNGDTRLELSDARLRDGAIDARVKIRKISSDEQGQ